MMKVGYEVKLFYYDSGFKELGLSFEKHTESLDDIKSSFLKRLWNIRGLPKKTMSEKSSIKKLTYQATSFEDWIQLVNENTWRWKLDVRKFHY